MSLEEKKRKNLDNKKFICACVFVFLTMLILNYLTVLYADDFSYSFVWGRDYRVSSIKDIIISQMNHYHIVNGRIEVHFLAQFFLLIGKKWFNIINALIYMCLILEIYYFIMNTFKNVKWKLIIIIHVSLWFLTPAFGENFLWLIGSCNYEIPMVLMLFYLIFYKNAIRDKYINKNLMFIFMAFLGIIVGASNEAIGMMTLLISVIYIIIAFREKQNKLWMLIGVIGNVIGVLSIIFSPGQGARLKNSGGFINIVGIAKNVIYILNDYFNYLLPIFLIVLVCGYIKRKEMLDKRNIENLIMIFSSAISVLMFAISPQMPKRVWIVAVILIVIAMLKLIKIMIRDSNIYSLITVTLIIAYFFSYSVACSQVNLIREQYFAREREIEKQKNETEVKLEPIYGYTKYSPYSEQGDLVDENIWPNTAIAKYYNVSKIVKK